MCIEKKCRTANDNLTKESLQPKRISANLKKFIKRFQRISKQCLKLQDMAEETRKITEVDSAICFIIRDPLITHKLKALTGRISS